MAADGRLHTKILIQKAIVLIYCWANDFSSKQTTTMLDTYGSAYFRLFDLNGPKFLDVDNGTITDWRNYLREVCLRALNSAPQMGGRFYMRDRQVSSLRQAKV